MPDGIDLAVTLECLHKADPANEAEWQRVWTDMVRQLWPYLLAVSSRSLSRRHPLLDAEDITQEVLFDLARRWPLANLTTPEALRSWLATSTHHRVVDRVRSLYGPSRDIRREQQMPMEELTQVRSSGASGPESQLRTQEALQEFQELFASDDLDRQIIAGLLDGWTQAEMAERLKVNPSTVSRRVERLKDLWSAWEHIASATKVPD